MSLPLWGRYVGARQMKQTLVTELDTNSKLVKLCVSMFLIPKTWVKDHASANLWNPEKDSTCAKLMSFLDPFRSANGKFRKWNFLSSHREDLPESGAALSLRRLVLNGFSCIYIIICNEFLLFRLQASIWYATWGGSEDELFLPKNYHFFAC